MSVIKKICSRAENCIKHHYPFIWSRILYKRTLGKVADFRRPYDINEKIQWLMFYTNTDVWSRLADKYAVRQYVKDKIGEDILVPLLGKWDSADEIDFNALPNEFVMKPNNGSYDTVICKDKSRTDCEIIRNKMAFSISHSFGYENAEPHYLKIKPCIIAEQLLSENGKGVTDYKIWCFNGKPYSIFVCANRDSVTHHADFICFDLQWEKHPEWIAEQYRSNAYCPRPQNLDGLLSVAAKLSEGFPQVRVDLYDIEGKIYFGEMTFSSNFGMMPYFTQEILDDMGRHCILPARTAKERITTFCNRWLPLL